MRCESASNRPSRTKLVGPTPNLSVRWANPLGARRTHVEARRQPQTFSRCPWGTYAACPPQNDRLPCCRWENSPYQTLGEAISRRDHRCRPDRGRNAVLFALRGLLGRCRASGIGVHGGLGVLSCPTQSTLVVLCCQMCVVANGHVSASQRPRSRRGCAFHGVCA